MEQVVLTRSLVCVNCDSQMAYGKRLLYCSEGCSQEAEYVRYARSVRKDGRINKADVQEALKIRLAFVLDGGYPTNERRVRADVRQYVMQRDGGKCRVCGQQATDIDHLNIMGGSRLNHPENLQALCASCHRQKTIAGLTPITPELGQERYDRLMATITELDKRVNARRPRRLCDDDVRWVQEWRRLAAKRRRAPANAPASSRSVTR